MFKFADILSVGINVACMKSFLEQLEENRELLQKGHFLHPQNHHYASKLISTSLKNFTFQALIMVMFCHRKRLLELFLSLRPECLNSLADGVTYRELKV